MKALIFNSGLGSRLGELTAHNPKSMVKLSNGETIFGRQLRVLFSCGIRDFVVTTGPYPEQLEEVAQPFTAKGARITFVPNTAYRETNYIYSMYLANKELRGNDIILLHGDLVFDAEYIQMMIDSPISSLGSVNPALPLPEKDFKARVIDGEVREVGVGIFDDDCITFQACYKLSAESLDLWLDAIEEFVERGETGVYAENAANTVFEHMHVKVFSYENHCCEEIDTPDDLARVSAQIRLLDFEQQPVFLWEEGALSLSEGHTTDAVRDAKCIGALISTLGMEHPLVVADSFFASKLDIVLGGALREYPTFSGYSPNPIYEEIVAGVESFRINCCDGLVSLGGGSAIDVAKCIKLFAPLKGNGHTTLFTSTEAGFSPIPHIAVPTTAGTGSESTHFAVTYVNGSKISVAHPCIHPDVVVLSPALLAGLPDYQKKATMLDALCQAIESYWSAKSSPESRSHSRSAIPAIMDNHAAYLSGDPAAAKAIAHAANQAGKAINLTTTTAAHAMSYKITSLYGCAHGHAVALCMPLCWRVLLERGDELSQKRLREIDALVTGDSRAELGAGLARFEQLYTSFGLESPHESNGQTLDLLAASVNVQRLSNFPVALTTDELKQMYRQILG